MTARILSTDVAGRPEGPGHKPSDRARVHRLAATMLAFLLLGPTLGCSEEGKVPDCPAPEEFAGQGGLGGSFRLSPGFEAWRKASEEAGCLTPVGGSERSGAGGSGGGG